MKEVLRFFELKNEYLEKFLNMTKVFIMKLENGIKVDSQVLKNNRENILSIIDHIDKKIVAEVGADINDSIAPNLIPEIGHLVFLKDNLVREIVALDSKLMKLLEIEKEQVKYDLNKLKDISEAMNTYSTDKDAKGNNLDIEK